MKHILSILILSSALAAANTDNLQFLRQHQQSGNLVWDMPAETEVANLSSLEIESKSALFQLWSVVPSQQREYLLDQKLAGAYLPKADIKVVTLDMQGKVSRTRVDQPFRVEIQIRDLLTGSGLPLASSSVLLEHHMGHHTAKKDPLDPVEVTSKSPAQSGYLSANGRHVMAFHAASLIAADPTKASGEEHFVIHALADGLSAQTQIASAKLQVWPVASGEIKGITPGQKFRSQVPGIELVLDDLYPVSDTCLMLFKGTQVTGATGALVKEFPVNGNKTESTVLPVNDLERYLAEDGTYTLALLSDTVYGRELLCDPVSFSIQRTIPVNAMQAACPDLSKR